MGGIPDTVRGNALARHSAATSLSSRYLYTLVAADSHPLNIVMKIPTNPMLEPFNVLVGQWEIVGAHPYLPGITLHGHTTIDWLSGGAFLIMHSEIDNPNFPRVVAIFGSDDVASKYFMLHFDDRGFSRKYDVSMTGNQLKWWRDDPSFSQRFTMTIEDNDKMVSTGEMSQGGGAWEEDLAITYIRLR